MKTPYSLKKLVGLSVGLVLSTTLLTHAERAGVANSSPETGTSRMVVVNKTGFTLDVTIGSETKPVLHLGRIQFESGSLFAKPYAIKTKLDPKSNIGEALRIAVRRAGATVSNVYGGLTGEIDDASEFDVVKVSEKVDWNVQNPDGIDGYLTPIDKVTYSIFNKAHSEDTRDVTVNLYAKYEWKDGYWVVTLIHQL